MNNINNKQKVTYGDTEYQDFADYNGSLKKLWEPDELCKRVYRKKLK